MTIQTRILFPLLISFFILSCASLDSRYESQGLSVTEQLNKGMDESLSENSLYPFVFETEILATDSQVKTLWQGLTGAGYTLEMPVITMNRPAAPKDYVLFSESWEIQTFFTNYLQHEDRILLIEGSNTSFYLLMRRTGRRTYKLLGWKEVQK